MKIKSSNPFISSNNIIKEEINFDRDFFLNQIKADLKKSNNIKIFKTLMS